MNDDLRNGRGSASVEKKQGEKEKGRKGEMHEDAAASLRRMLRLRSRFHTPPTGCAAPDRLFGCHLGNHVRPIPHWQFDLHADFGVLGFGGRQFTQERLFMEQMLPLD